ncbi:hypothetical protein HanIR_Chr13g0646541 [Helianthus annuus]|nr:hypothetical protein HanIR_Chr13g0646541 [Helianthus annuus]
MDYGGNHVLQTASGNQPAAIGIDRFMSITNMHRFPLCTCVTPQPMAETSG